MCFYRLWMKLRKAFTPIYYNLFTRLLNTFTSKVSNLLLPWEVEGAGDFKSHPTSETHNKYIYDGFLMTFWHLKRVIGD